MIVEKRISLLKGGDPHWRYDAMTHTTNRRESISFASVLAFLAGSVAGASLVTLLCLVILLLSGCSALQVTTRNNGDDQESCVVIKVPSAVRVCFPSSLDTEVPQ